MQDTNNSGQFQWSGVLLISFCHFIHDVFSSFLSPLLPLLVEKLAINLTYAGFLGTITQLPALLNPFIGKWADRGKTIHWLIVLAPTMTAIPMSLLGLAPSYGVVVLLLLMVGISTSLFHVPAPVIIAQLSGNKKGQGMSFFMIGGEFSRIVGPIAAVGVVSLWGLEGYYPVMIIGMLSSVLIYFRLKDVPITFQNKNPVPLRESWKEIKQVMGPLTGILVARGFMHGSLATFLPLFIKQETGSLWHSLFIHASGKKKTGACFLILSVCPAGALSWIIKPNPPGPGKDIGGLSGKAGTRDATAPRS